MVTDVAGFAVYLPSSIRDPLSNELRALADKVLTPTVSRYIEDAERHPPHIESHDAFAQRTDVLKTSEGWRKLQDLGSVVGCVSDGYSNGRMVQFAKYFIFSPSSALVTCPFAMTDGAARLLSRHLIAPPKYDDPQAGANFMVPTYNLSPQEADAETSRRLFKRAYVKLISKDPKIRWTSGQWMTERPGGSDVSQSETTAVYSPVGRSEDPETGPWVLNGHKFFSSATDADMAIVLARTQGNQKLSAFYVPMRLPGGLQNGIRIVRLKKKLGTRALPTAELELNHTRAYLIGQEGHGIREISTVLNITRVHNSVSAASFMRRALEVAKAYSKVRLVNAGRPLSKNPLHLRTLARLELLTRAATHLSFLTVHLLALSELPSSTHPASILIPTRAAPLLLRIITPMTKAVTAKISIAVISESIEALGGIGYLENEEPLNLARLLRDAQVLSIWEGTTNVLITDLVGMLKRESSREEERGVYVLREWVRENLTTNNSGRQETLEHCKVEIWKEWLEVEGIIESSAPSELVANGRRVMWRLAWVVVGVCFLVDARMDNDAVAVELCRRWINEGFSGEAENNTDPKEDEKVVFGDMPKPRL